MRNVYPEIMPDCICKLPDLLKGKVANAAEIFLSAKCDYDGALACEMAARLLDEEMISEDTAYSFQERWDILSCAHQFDDWSVATHEKVQANPVVREKVDFVLSLAASYGQRERDNFIRLMNEAAHCARYLARIYRERMEEKSAAQAREVENVA